jgi:hypothetical protein
MAANKLFKSDDRGETWDVISDDLTAQLDRNKWPVMGKYWSSDAVAKDVSTSQYGTIVALDESPVKEGLIYVGTDDGLIQITEDDGKTWRKVASLPGVPENTYVSDLFASRFDENVVFATFDNLKSDDFKPYILKSNDKGKTWKSISGNLPENGSVHTINQDFKNENLLFTGTEFGVFFSINGGQSWVQLKSGIPTIAVYDITIQERETDLVIATFGRGFYILDNYSPLRSLNEEAVEQDAFITEVKDALLYIQKGGKGSQGATYFVAKNPTFGAEFTLYLKDIPKTEKQLRVENDKKLFKDSKPIPQPSWKALEDEKKETPPYMVITIRDESGSIVRTMTKKPAKGIQRINWDLRYDSPDIRKYEKFNPLVKTNGSVFVMPGTYSVEMALVHNGVSKPLGEKTSFNVVGLNNATLPAEDRAGVLAFQKEVSRISKAMNGTLRLTEDLLSEINTMQQTAITLPGAHEELLPALDKVKKELDDIKFKFRGSKAKASWEEIPPAEMPLMNRLNNVIYTQINSTSNITSTSKMGFEILKEKFPPVLKRVTEIAKTEMAELRKMLDDMDAPYTQGRIPVWE